jgi:hypothetical protein
MVYDPQEKQHDMTQGDILKALKPLQFRGDEVDWAQEVGRFV